jgi:aldehyde:ferredoxin oxidoreductase
MLGWVRRALMVCLPERFTAELLPVYVFNGGEPSAHPVHVGRVRNLDAMRAGYYCLRGWDENGIPRPETLARLGLSERSKTGTSYPAWTAGPSSC